MAWIALRLKTHSLLICCHPSMFLTHYRLLRTHRYAFPYPRKSTHVQLVTLQKGRFLLSPCMIRMYLRPEIRPVYFPQHTVQMLGVIE